MMDVYIEAKNQIAQNRIRYVMKQLLVPIGFPFRFQIVLGEYDGDFSIACIPESKLENYGYDEKFDLIIPYGEYDSWLADDVDIKVDKVEGIYALYIGKMPSYLIHDGKVGFDLINIVFYLLSRQEEYIYEHRDFRDRFCETYSLLYENGILGYPVINYYIKELESYIQQRMKYTPIPKWKDGASYAVILSHDVDHLTSKDISVTLNQVLQAKKSSSPIASTLISIKELISFARSSKPTWDFSYWTERERDFGFRSTFFFAANAKERDWDDPSYWVHSKLLFQGKKMPMYDVARMIEGDGWEIGLHGSINTYHDQELLSKEKELLAKQTGCSIVGIRQHYLCLDVRKTWLIHERLGFSYDTTLGYSGRNGFRAGIAFPFNPYDMIKEREYSLLELPMSIMDGNFFSDKGEKLDYHKSIKRYDSLSNSVMQTEGILVVNFHPHYYDKAYPDWWALYEYILNHLLESSAWVTTGRKITEWWKDRAKCLSEKN